MFRWSEEHWRRTQSGWYLITAALNRPVLCEECRGGEAFEWSGTQVKRRSTGCERSKSQRSVPQGYQYKSPEWSSVQLIRRWQDGTKKIAQKKKNRTPEIYNAFAVDSREVIIGDWWRKQRVVKLTVSILRFRWHWNVSVFSSRPRHSGYQEEVGHWMNDYYFKLTPTHLFFCSLPGSWSPNSVYLSSQEQPFSAQFLLVLPVW